jgi:hypothetical protein
MLTLFLSAAVAVAIAWFIRDPDKDYIMPGVSNGVVLGLRESDKTKKNEKVRRLLLRNLQREKVSECPELCLECYRNRTKIEMLSS